MGRAAILAARGALRGGRRADRRVVRPDDPLAGQALAAVRPRVQQGVQAGRDVVVNVNVHRAHRRVLLELQVVLGARGAHEAARVAETRGVRLASIALARALAAFAFADPDRGGAGRVRTGALVSTVMAQHLVRTGRYRVMMMVIVVIMVMVGVMIVVPQRVDLLLVLREKTAALLGARQIQHQVTGHHVGFEPAP